MLEKAATYLDTNAGGPLHPHVKEALFALLQKSSEIGNPSSPHTFGRQARGLILRSVDQIAHSLGAIHRSNLLGNLFFTSGGTEANQLVIRSVLESKLLEYTSQTTSSRSLRPHWITTSVEHDSVLQMITWFRDRGGEVDLLPVDDNGALDVSALHKIWRPGKTALVSAIWVNNETGVISDVVDLARAVQELGGILHIDAAQAWGKIPINLDSLGAQFVTFSGHKIGALPGIGAVWASQSSPRISPTFSTVLGKQQNAVRGGTENLFGIVSLGAAASCIAVNSWQNQVNEKRAWLETEIVRTIPHATINGKTLRVWQTR